MPKIKKKLIVDIVLITFWSIVLAFCQPCWKKRLPVYRLGHYFVDRLRRGTIERLLGAYLPTLVSPKNYKENDRGERTN